MNKGSLVCSHCPKEAQDGFDLCRVCMEKEMMKDYFKGVKGVIPLD